MRKLALCIAALASIGTAAAPAVARQPSGDEKLAKLLEGRVPGKPQSCINTFVNRESQVIDRTAVVYGHGRTIWVNVPQNPRDLDDGDALLVRQYGSQLCKQDIVTTFDTTSGFYTGNVFLTDFVPYTRAD